MKTLRNLTLGLIAACLTAGSASAYTIPGTTNIVHIAGSTAFRTATVAAVIDVLSGKTTASGSNTKTVYAEYFTSGKNVTSDSYAILADGYIDGTTSPQASNIVECSWTGSLAGLVDLINGSASAATSVFPNENDPGVQKTLSTSGSAIPAGTYASGAAFTADTADGGSTTGLKTSGDAIQLTMSDSLNTTVAAELATCSFVSGTTIGSSITTPAQLATAVGGNTVVEAGATTSGAGTVGIVPFQWWLGAYSGTPSYVPSNISQQQAAALLSVGFIPQASFTGTNNKTTDQSTTFYLIGRNEDSGTRIGALAESHFGVTGSPNQFILPTGSGYTGTWSQVTTTGTVTGTDIESFPVNSVLNTEPKIYWKTAGHSGYASGSNVEGALAVVSNGTTPAAILGNGTDLGTSAAYFIGYLGLTDGNTAAGANCTALTYNGVPFKNENVANGSYSFWTFEHAYRLSSLTGSQLTVANEIADLIHDSDADAYVSGSSFVHAETASGSGVYTESTAGLSPGNAGLRFDAGITVGRSFTEGAPVTSKF